MPSENRIVAYLDDEDKKLFDRAVKLYDIGDSELIRKIISNWLFNNQLQLTQNHHQK